MKIIFSPKDGDRREFVFRAGELMSDEAELLEECGGNSWATYEEFGRRFVAGSVRAMRAALWIMLRREQPRLRLADVTFRVDEMDLDYEDDEIVRLRDFYENDDELSDEQRAELLAAIDNGGVVDTEVPPAPVGKGEPGDSDTDSP